MMTKSHVHVHQHQQTPDRLLRPITQFGIRNREPRAETMGEETQQAHREEPGSTGGIASARYKSYRLRHFERPQHYYLAGLQLVGGFNHGLTM